MYETDKTINIWWSGGFSKLGKNFGDFLAGYLAEKISGKKPVFTGLNGDTYIITGSVLNMNGFTKRNIVWGAGIMFQNRPVAPVSKYCAVRGPITRKRLLELNYKVPEIYGDPAIVLPKYYRPRIDKDILAELNEGLICTSGCLKGEICGFLIRAETEKAAQAAEEYLKIFGPERYFIELQQHEGTDTPLVNEQLIDIAKKAGIGLGKPYALTNFVEERTENCYLLFSLPKCRVRADIIEFVQ